MVLNRKISESEKRILKFLVDTSTIEISENWESSLKVETMDDGGMGSLKLIPTNITTKSKRKLGKVASQCQFLDIDGVTVIATLNLDKKNQLFELDIWKTDFSPLKKIPINFESIER